MGSITNFLEAEALDHIFNAAYSPASSIYLCLCTGDPTDAATGGSMNECADSGSYARTAITFNAAGSRAIVQTAQVTFPEATGSWGTVSHWAIATSGTHGGGDCLAHGAFAASKAIVSGNTPSVGAGEIDVTFSAGEFSDYLANILLDFAFRNQTFTQPDTYVGLCTATVADGDDGDSITEPSGGAYARKQVNPNGGSSPTWDNAVSGDPSYVDNGEEISFVTATADWGQIVAVAICDALTSGEVLVYDNTMADQNVYDGDTAKFAAAALVIQLS